MTTQMTYGSLFAGVGGFDLGFETAGMKCLFQVEWDKHCQQTLQHHWPDVPKWGDVSTVNGADLPPVDVITFGSPCQDLSTAGKRAGLDGGRSGLFFEATRIIKEMRDATNGIFPRVAVWENVPGAFSSNEGHDFGSVLDGLGNVGALGIEWAVLDARWFGVPQRRRRIFVVAEFDPARASRGGEPLLAVGKGSARDLATRKKQEQDATGEVVACLRSGGDGEVPSSRGEHLVPFATNRRLGIGEYVEDDCASAICARDHKDATDLVVGFSHTAGIDNQFSADVFPTLRAGGGGNAVSYDATHDGKVPAYNNESPTLTQRMGTGGNNVPLITDEPIPIQGTVVGRQDHNGPGGSGVAEAGSPMYTLETSAPHCIEHEMVVRRLTPVECERLMGWPDNHTLYRADGKVNADSTRYKMCGNGVASPVAEWVGRQIIAGEPA